MLRLTLLVALAILTLACSGVLGAVPFVDRSSGATLSFEEGDTEATGQLLAFDPTHHSLEISIAMPLEQSDDIDVFIVTSNGIRFQVLSSFQDCRIDGANRLCDRSLPVLPAEGIENWRVEALRSVSAAPGSVTVDITWVRVGS